MKLFSKITDERQELELLKIYSLSFWVLFVSLAISFIVQVAFFNAAFQQIIGEIISLLICSGTLVVGCVVKGQWNINTKSSIKLYLATGFITALIYSAISIIRIYVSGMDIAESFFPVFAIRAVCMFAIISVSTAIIGVTINKRKQNLEKKYKDNE